MKNRILLLIFLFGIIIFSNCMGPREQGKIEKLAVYKSFIRGGTTVRIINAFSYPVNYSHIRKKDGSLLVDTTNINIGTNMFLAEFSEILSTSKRSRHFQQKIAGENIAGEFWLNSNRHFFIFFYSSRLLIDFTDRKEYKITDEVLLQKIYDWINIMKK